MCGRFSLFAPPDDLEDRFDASFEYPYQRRYNAAPGQALPVITDERPDGIRAFEWGLVPLWADGRDDVGDLINARGETVAEKPSFRRSFAGVDADAEPTDEAAGRCLVLADGFYEWSGERGSKEPYRVQREDEQPFAFAGLWETWTAGTDEGDGETGEATAEDEETPEGGAAPAEEAAPEGGPAAEDDAAAEEEAVRTLTIITTDSNDVVASIHDRMPVILAADEEEPWLDDGDPGLLDPFENEPLEAYPVSTAVNDPTNDSPEVVEPLDTEQSGFEEFTD